MKTNFMQQLQMQPRSSHELKDVIRRFEMKWQRKVKVSAKHQPHWLGYSSLPHRKKTPNHLREGSFLVVL